MAAEKRVFTNFKAFPGSINKVTNNYEFPTLYHAASNGKMREWTIYVRLIKEASKAPKLTKKQNWNLLEEDQVFIHEEYLNDDYKLDGVVAQWWTESGYVGMMISRSAPTYVKPKNMGKKNERNTFHQALVEARSKYLKKTEDGSQQKGEDTSNSLILPMLAVSKGAVTYPVFIQPKLDGDRCIVYLNKAPPSQEKNVILYSRRRKEYPVNATTEAIRRNLKQVLEDNYDVKHEDSIYFDGELYEHGVPLQSIGSVIRKEGSTDLVQYHIYDMFYPHYTNEPFSYRYKQLKNIYDLLPIEAKDIIKLVPTHLVHSRKEEDSMYRKFLNSGYEGAMLRNPTGAYAKSTVRSSEIRSKALIKRKEVFDGEYEIVNYTEGVKGKEIGAVIWICQTSDGKQFNVVPNGTLESRYKLYKDCKRNFITKYKNRLLKVEYRGLTEDGIPSHARAIGFRDFD
jgi:DNA ligase-1